MTRTPLSRSKCFKVKVTRPLCSPTCWRVRRLQRWAWKHVGRGNGKLLLRYRRLGGARRFDAHVEKRGAGHIVAAARLQLVDSELYSRDRRFSRGRLETATCCSVKHYLFTSTFKIDVLCPTPLTFHLKWGKILRRVQKKLPMRCNKLEAISSSFVSL